MTSTGSEDASWLRPITTGGEPLLTRAGQVVYASRRLSELVHGRPPGITGNQWSTAIREGFDQVVCAANTGRPLFAVEIAAAPAAGSPEQRAERMKSAVCAAVGLEVLRIESPTLRGADHGRRIVEYVIDARGYADATVAGPEGVEPVGFRDIVGRLPDGRSGHVNDLGALTRAAVVEAYVDRRLADPIVRGLHARWKNGPAEGWSWVGVRPGRCLVERVRLYPQRFSCGVDPARLAEDLSALAVGERLRGLDAGEPPSLMDRDQLRRDIRLLASHEDQMEGDFAFAHLCAD
ncbi:uncharacterized protein DUF2726 [Micromonospora kangleipakensis]|uniref:Uncharacterized protein DUF2726 n=1 Tax=Micromonospora kangleipakensis TaxID=1077942 RepID=A0A4Q8BER9_9ACTN|nr:DUF2726 domain-containing protein [Micromonospora kangleipakensis]RZU76447.1 uncharacterized protein DUF2726 [Micromonospora kangleipakensis]